MKNKKIILMSLGLLLIVATLVVSISSWLTDTKQTPDTTFSVGDVKYTIVSDFIADGIIVPGQELIANTSEVAVPIKLTNSSTVTTHLRVRVIVTKKEKGAVDPAPIVEDLNSIFTTSTESGGNFVLATNWKKHVTESNTWYYEVVAGDPIIPAGTQTLDVVSSLKLDGSKVGNNYVNDVITIKFIFEAKQSKYVTWEELATATIDFSTGLTKV